MKTALMNFANSKLGGYFIYYVDVLTVESAESHEFDEYMSLRVCKTPWQCCCQVCRILQVRSWPGVSFEGIGEEISVSGLSQEVTGHPGSRVHVT